MAGTDNTDDINDDWDWAEFNAFMKERHRTHVAKNMTDYEKYVLLMESFGFSHQPQGAGIRFTHVTGLRIDFWKQSGKWTEVGTNVYTQGPKRMVKYVKARLTGTLPGRNGKGRNHPKKNPDRFRGAPDQPASVRALDPNGITTDNDTPPWEP